MSYLDVWFHWPIAGLPRDVALSNPYTTHMFPAPPERQYIQQARGELPAVALSRIPARPLREHLQALQARGYTIARVGLIGFSESCAGVREVLRSQDAGLVDTVVAIDGTHAPYDNQHMPAHSYVRPWAAFAKLCARPESVGRLSRAWRMCVITHSSIVIPGYADTSEVATSIIQELGLPDEGVSWPSEGGHPLTRAYRSGDFYVFGYEGDQARDHVYQANQVTSLVFKRLVAPRLNDYPPERQLCLLD